MSVSNRRWKAWVSFVAASGFAVTAAAGSMNGAAGGAGANGMGASGIANGIGSSLLAQGSAELPPCQQQQCSCCMDAIMKMLMGLMGLMQGAGNKDTAQSQFAQQDLSNDYGTGAGGPAETAARNDVRAGAVAKIAEIKAKMKADLAKSGIKFDPETLRVTTATGASFGPDDIMNQAAMQAAGVTPEGYKKNMADAKAAEAKAIAASKAQEAGAAGGGTSFSGMGSWSPKSSGPAEEVAGGGSARPSAASAVGATAVVNGATVGGSAMDIFSMMSRRYREKRAKDAFLPPEAVPEPPAPPRI